MKYLKILRETPSKKNCRITLKNGKSIVSARYRKWHEYACSQLLGYSKNMIDKECYIILHFIHGDNIRRDSDNGVSSIFDTLQDMKILSDDRWQIVKSHIVFNSYQQKQPCCEIRIYEKSEKDLYSRDILEMLKNFC